MSQLRTRDVLALIPSLVWDQLYRANHPSGAPSDRDLAQLTRREQRKLRGPVGKVADELRNDQDVLTNDEVAKEAIRRLRIAVRAVAGKVGTRDGEYLSQEEIERIADREVRDLVRNAADLKAKLDNWYVKDPEIDGVEGASVNRTHLALAGRPLQETIVAVLDSGVDIDHEDLKNKLWTNPGEIPGNGIDDDGNGYVDDVHGWNFLGSVDAAGNPINIEHTTLEVARELRRMKKLQSERRLTADERVYLAQLRREVEAGQARERRRSEQTGKPMRRYYDETFDPRAEVLGDDPDDLSPAGRFYGNNDVKGPNPRHGTHVAGIIAGERGNGLGFDGVAEAVKIMSVRVVPDGDEYDKDVANGIRYAVDNGAHVINMSFGKAYSPHADAVREAMRYAVERGVILVHAAGNDGKDNDITTHYPARPEEGKEQFGTWIEVGAMSALQGPGLPARFSNYGDESVDIFAPGVRIDATLPNNTYGALNGTSMATPVVAGVLAMLRSAYPDVPPEQIAQVVLDTARTYPNLKVWVPDESGRKKRVDFASLSTTGGVVDALAAARQLEVIKSLRRSA